MFYKIDDYSHEEAMVTELIADQLSADQRFKLSESLLVNWYFITTSNQKDRKIASVSYEQLVDNRF